MRIRKTPITRLLALGLVAGAAAAPVASADTASWSERAGDVAAADGAPAPACAAWARWASYEVALYGVFGAQADSYLASRADNPCAQPLTLRSLFHAGDPGAI